MSCPWFSEPETITTTVGRCSALSAEMDWVLRETAPAIEHYRSGKEART